MVRKRYGATHYKIFSGKCFHLHMSGRYETKIGIVYEHWRVVQYRASSIVDNITSLHVGASTTPLQTCGAIPYGESRPTEPFLTGSKSWLDFAEGVDHAEGPPACFVVT